MEETDTFQYDQEMGKQFAWNWDIMWFWGSLNLHILYM
jgi:hypothetical protein